MTFTNPLRCWVPGCAFYAVVEGGMCEECEAEAFAAIEGHDYIEENEYLDVLEAEADEAWEREQFERIEREDREDYWARTEVEWPGGPSLIGGDSDLMGEW